MEPTPCPVCGVDLKCVHQPGRHLLICDNCGWVKDFLRNRQTGGDPRYEIESGKGRT